jgi:excisionase family DNA binding protein
MPEAAEITGLSLSSIKMLIGREQLRIVRVGRRVLIPAAELDRLLAAN